MAVPTINTTLLSRSELPVYLTKVESPTLFWVQLKYNRTPLYEMEEELTWLMERRARRYTFFAHAVTVGCTVAVKNGPMWSRGRIDAINHETVIIHLGDWGRSIKRSIYALYQLPVEFHWMPWQAIPCGIFGLVPPRGLTTWPLSTRGITKRLAQRTEGWIRIKQTVASTAADVDLVIGLPGRIGYTSLKTELVSLRQAELATNSNLRPHPSI